LRPRRPSSRLLLVAGLAVLYVVAGKVGLHLAVVHPSASAVWPPSGIALAGLLILGSRVWPVIFLGAFLVNVTTEGSLATSAGIAAGNTLEAVIGAYLVTRFANGKKALDRAPDIFTFVLLAAVCSTTVSAFVGVTSLSLAGYAPWANYGAIWLTWWLGDATGDLIVAPLLILWAEDRTFTAFGRRGIEAGLLLFSLVLVGLAVVTDLPPYPAQGARLQFLCIPVLLWAAFRFGRRAVATGTVFLSAMAVAGALRGLRPTSGVTLNESLLLLQVFVAVMAVTTLSIATLVWERRRIEDALREGEARYRLLAEAGPQIVFATTAEGRGTYRNRRWYDYTGLTPEEPWDSGWVSAVHPDDVEPYGAAWQRALQAQEPFERECRLRRADGVYRWHLGRVVPWKQQSNDRAAGWIGTLTDIDDTKRLEAERERLLAGEHEARVQAEATSATLHRLQMVTDTVLPHLTSADLLRALLARVRIALESDTATVLLLDADGQYLVPVASDDRREPAADAIRIPLGRGVAGRIAASDSGVLIEELAAVDGASLFLPDRVRSLVGAPLKVDGRMIGVIHAGAMGARRFTPEDLRLLGLVAHRAGLAIERARLHDAERAARTDAEAASRAKDEFLAMLSHELHTPLSVILLWAKLLRAGRLDQPTASRALDIIEQNCLVQSQMIVDLLDVSRIIAGKLMLSLQPIDLAPVVDTAIESLSPTADAKGIAIVTRLDRGTGVIICDPQRLQQVIGNLLSNAVKFTPEGGRVDVALARVGEETHITVSDTGQGISREFLPRVFERFQQADHGLTRGHGGLGLGLAIVRHLVELHGGTVSASSEGEGKGATFTVRLPRTGPVTGASSP